MTTRAQAPSDTTAAKAWDTIMRMARDNALICQAAGGVATLAIPTAQREAGIREKVLAMHMMVENAGTCVDVPTVKTEAP